MRPYLFLLLLSILVFSCKTNKNIANQAQVEKIPETTKLEKDLELLSTWFDGEFNNYQQVHKAKEDSIDIELIHENIHSIFKKVDVPWLGNNVYFVKQYMDNNPEKIYRQRMYNFTINKEENAIQLDILSFVSPELEKVYVMSDKEPSLLSTLTQKELRPAPGCEVYWQKQDDHFIGYMKERACNFLSKRSGKRIFITDSLMLNKNEIWISDEAEDEDGNYVFGHKGKIPHKLKKVQHYKGWAAAKNSEDSEMTAIRGLRFHNQGDRQKIVFQDGTETGYDVRLSQLIYGKGLEILQIALFQTGEEKVMEYIWADAHSERVGINIKGKFQIGLTRE